MSILKSGVRVDTIYGQGTITDFEIINHINMPIIYSMEYDGKADLCRIGVKLDNPKNWVCHGEISDNPYFLLNDLLDWEI